MVDPRLETQARKPVTRRLSTPMRFLLFLFPSPVLFAAQPNGLISFSDDHGSAGQRKDWSGITANARDVSAIVKRVRGGEA